MTITIPCPDLDLEWDLEWDLELDNNFHVSGLSFSARDLGRRQGRGMERGDLDHHPGAGLHPEPHPRA